MNLTHVETPGVPREKSLPPANTPLPPVGDPIPGTLPPLRQKLSESISPVIRPGYEMKVDFYRECNIIQVHEQEVMPHSRCERGALAEVAGGRYCRST